MLTIAGGIFIAAATIALFAGGVQLVTVGDHGRRIEAILSGAAFILISGTFALWVVLLR